jgi:uncharacterized membrane protein YgcG
MNNTPSINGEIGKAVASSGFISDDTRAKAQNLRRRIATMDDNQVLKVNVEAELDVLIGITQDHTVNDTSLTLYRKTVREIRLALSLTLMMHAMDAIRYINQTEIFPMTTAYTAYKNRVGGRGRGGGGNNTANLDPIEASLANAAMSGRVVLEALVKSIKSRRTNTNKEVYYGYVWAAQKDVAKYPHIMAHLAQGVPNPPNRTAAIGKSQEYVIDYPIMLLCIMRMINKMRTTNGITHLGYGVMFDLMAVVAADTSRKESEFLASINSVFSVNLTGSKCMAKALQNEIYLAPYVFTGKRTRTAIAMSSLAVDSYPLVSTHFIYCELSQGIADLLARMMPSQYSNEQLSTLIHYFHFILASRSPFDNYMGVVGNAGNVTFSVGNGGGGNGGGGAGGNGGAGGGMSPMNRRRQDTVFQQIPN